MFLDIFNEYLTTVIIFVGVVLVIILAYLFFYVPKSKKRDNSEKLEDSSQSKIDVLDESVEIPEEQKIEPVEEKMEDEVLEEDIIVLEDDRVEISNDTPLIDENIKSEGPDGEIKEEEKTEEETKKEIDDTFDEENDQVSEDSIDETSSEEDLVKETKELGKYHVLYRKDDGKWYVKREGSEKVLRVLETQAEAIAWATIKALNQDTAIVIHKRDGKIRKQNY
ncbi:MAG: DUF2188 domain-containing protein [Candidatus Izemoplasmatales bacterium]